MDNGIFKIPQNPITDWINDNLGFLNPSDPKNAPAEGSLLDRAKGLLKPIEKAGNEAVDKATSALTDPVQKVLDQLGAKFGPVFARIALALLAIVLIAAAFWLLSSGRKMQLVQA